MAAQLITHETKAIHSFIITCQSTTQLTSQQWDFKSPAITIFSSFIFHNDRLKQFWFLSITLHAHTNLSDLNDLYMQSIIGHHLLKEMGNEIGISYSYKLPQLCLIKKDGRKCKRLNM
jgi:hypothetical protein